MQEYEIKAYLLLHHYLHSLPAGGSLYFEFDGILISFSISGNRNLSSFVVGRRNAVLELSRLWAPDDHAPNALTSAISRAIGIIRATRPKVQAIVAYADTAQGHSGSVYRAASFIYFGRAGTKLRFVKPLSKRAKKYILAKQKDAVREREPRYKHKRLDGLTRAEWLLSQMSGRTTLKEAQSILERGGFNAQASKLLFDLVKAGRLTRTERPFTYTPL